MSCALLSTPHHLSLEGLSRHMRYICLGPALQSHLILSVTSRFVLPLALPTGWCICQVHFLHASVAYSCIATMVAGWPSAPYNRPSKGLGHCSHGHAETHPAHQAILRDWFPRPRKSCWCAFADHPEPLLPADRLLNADEPQPSAWLRGGLLRKSAGLWAQKCHSVLAAAAG